MGKYNALGLTRDRALTVCGLTRHQYYHRPKNGKRGRKISKQTQKSEKGKMSICSNEQVVEWIRERQSDPDLASGYHRMTAALTLAGFVINPKKVYRLMKEHLLLLAKPKSPGKKYARYRTVAPSEPLKLFEMDIKLVYCTKDRRHAQVLTVIDTFTRVVIYWEVGFSMKKERILALWRGIIEWVIQPSGRSTEIHIEVRNDNGPQFSAFAVREFFEQNGLDHVFTHPYTPQENGHIESFHATLSKSLDACEFWSIEDLEDRLDRFYENYNNHRIHSSIANLPPNLFWQLWNDGRIKREVVSKRKVRFRISGEAGKLLGNGSLKGVPCHTPVWLEIRELRNEKVDGPLWPITLKNNHWSKDRLWSFPASANL